MKAKLWRVWIGRALCRVGVTIKKDGKLYEVTGQKYYGRSHNGSAETVYRLITEFIRSKGVRVGEIDITRDEAVRLLEQIYRNTDPRSYRKHEAKEILQLLRG